MNQLRRLITLALALTVAVVPRRVAAQVTNAVPSADSTGVLAAEREIWEAIKKSDWSAVDTILTGMTYANASGIVVWKPGMSKDLKGLVLTSYAWADVQTRSVGPDLVLLTYKATADQTLNGQKTPSPVFMMSLWRKQSGRWVAVAHSETPAAIGR